MNLKRFKHSIYDFLADYKPIQENQRPGIFISNHGTWLDMLYLMTEKCSFLSKALLGKSLLLGNFAIARQSLFINRSSKIEKERVFQEINQRVTKAQNGILPPVFIFPEGTIGNGHVLMKFKRGAFCHKSPIKIYAFKLPKESEFIFNYANMNPVISIMLSLGRIWSTMEFHEIEEPLDPYWVAKKYNISIDDPEFWKIFAEECKEILSFLLDLQKVEKGFKELTDFEELECRKYDDIDLKLFNRKCVDKKKEI